MKGVRCRARLDSVMILLELLLRLFPGSGSGFRDLGLGCRGQGAGFLVQGVWLRVQVEHQKGEESSPD